MRTNGASAPRSTASPTSDAPAQPSTTASRNRVIGSVELCHRFAALALREKEGGVDRGADGQRNRERGERLPCVDACQLERAPHRRHDREADEEKRAASEPALPLRAEHDPQEPRRALEIPDEEPGRGEEREHADAREEQRRRSRRDRPAAARRSKAAAGCRRRAPS
jgi:hypothetical protein